jgi:outer membrane translocation and assembly module TamA
LSRNSILEAGFLAETGNLDNSFLLSEEINYDAYGSYFYVGYDNLNSASFPTDGNRLSLTFLHKNEHVKNVTLENGDLTQFGTQSTQLAFEWKGAVSIESHAFVAKAELNKVYVKNGEFSINNTSLGGFLNMSGFNEGDLTGPHKVFAALIYQYDLRGGFFKRTGLPFYLGVSAEAGNVWDQNEKIDADDFIYGGSLYLGTDTIMGPVALGYGANDDGANSVYFYLGYEL